MIVFDFRAQPHPPLADVGALAHRIDPVKIIAAPFTLHPPRTVRDALIRQVWRTIDQALATCDPLWRAPSAAQDLLIGESLIDQETAIVLPQDGLAALLLMTVWRQRFGFRPWIIVLWDQNAMDMISLEDE